MKKTVIVLSAMLMTTSLAFLSSCKKKTYANTDQLATLSSTTVYGTAYAILTDTFGAPGNQFAPAGTVINAWIDSKDLLYYTDSIAPYAPRYYSATVGANGKYAISVDVSLYRGATVHLVPAQFTANFVTKETSAPFAVYTVSKTYTSVEIPVAVTHDSSMTQDIEYIGK